MLLVVDIGNTCTKFKIMDSEYKFTLNTSDYSNIEDLKKVFPMPKENIDKCIISCVCLNKDKIIKEFVDEIFNINSLVVNHDMNTIIKYPKENNELGSDLIALMEGASLCADTHITITLGTATVINLVINNVYIGTVISPGVLSSLSGLVGSTSLLKMINLNDDCKLLGVNTEECLNSGLINGFTFLLDGFISKIKEEYQLSHIQAYITGGFSKIFSEKLTNECICDENIIYKGLENLYKLNSK